MLKHIIQIYVETLLLTKFEVYDDESCLFYFAKFASDYFVSNLC